MKPVKTRGGAEVGGKDNKIFDFGPHIEQSEAEGSTRTKPGPIPGVTRIYGHHDFFSTDSSSATAASYRAFVSTL